MFKIYTFLFVCLFLCSTVLADDRTMLSINGVGTVKASPDMATVSVGVVTQEVTPELALKVNSDSVSKILADLKAANIEEKDVETSSFSIQPKYEYDDNKQIFDLKILGLKTIYEFLGALEQEQFLKEKQQELKGEVPLNTESNFTVIGASPKVH